MNLVVVESPTKARTLSRFLGKDYQIKATMGHVRDLPKSVLGVDVKHDFAPEYVVVERREENIKEFKTLAGKAKQVILATDPDREGEAIAYHVAYLIGSNGKGKKQDTKVARIVFHEITKSAVERALENPGKIKMDLVEAQQGRRILDRLVGYKLSPLLWRKIRRGLSAGRVQSVAVRLIVERERQIEAFKPKEYWNVDVEVQKIPGGKKERKGVFVGRLVKIEGKKAEIKNKKQVDKVVADLKKAAYVVEKVEKKKVRQYPRAPFITSTLQQAAARFFGWSSKKTMREAQQLYEKGLITYHRTDSTNLSQVALKRARLYINSTYGEQYLPEKPRMFRRRSKMVQAAHEAIRPTKVKLKQLSGKARQDHRKLYELIWKRFVACQMAEAVFDRTTIEVGAKYKMPKAKLRQYLLRARGRVMKFDGWQAVYGEAGSGKLKARQGDQKLPLVEEGEKLKRKKVMAEQKFTEPPARFSEASLIKKLEELGIGRPSTYAPIISTIQQRQYVERKERRFWPTPVGATVVDFLLKYFPQVMDYDFTAQMEDDLDEIARGKKKWVEVVGDFYSPFEKKLKQVAEKAKRVKVEVEKTGRKCPECKQGDVVIRIGRFGKFLSCSRFPKCRWTDTYVEKVKGVKCPECKRGAVVIRKTRKGKRFYGCSRYPKCKWASWRKPKKVNSA